MRVKAPAEPWRHPSTDWAEAEELELEDGVAD
jgi:hypothetical protein